MPLPAHAPTDASRAQVQTASGFGLPQDQIGALLGIDDKTLRKHYPDDLAIGRAKAGFDVASTLHARAMQGDTSCLIWYSKCMLRWAPPPAVVEVSGLISISSALEQASARLAHDAIDGECVEVPEPE